MWNIKFVFSSHDVFSFESQFHTVLYFEIIYFLFLFIYENTWICFCVHMSVSVCHMRMGAHGYQKLVSDLHLSRPSVLLKIGT